MSKYPLTDMPCVNRILDCLNDWDKDSSSNREDNLNKCLWTYARSGAGVGKDGQKCKWTKKEERMWPKGRSGLNSQMPISDVQEQCNFHWFHNCIPGNTQDECDTCLDKSFHDGICNINDFVALKKYNVCQGDQPVKPSLN